MQANTEHDKQQSQQNGTLPLFVFGFPNVFSLCILLPGQAWKNRTIGLIRILIYLVDPKSLNNFPASISVENMDGVFKEVECKNTILDSYGSEK